MFRKEKLRRKKSVKVLPGGWSLTTKQASITRLPNYQHSSIHSSLETILIIEHVITTKLSFANLYTLISHHNLQAQNRQIKRHVLLTQVASGQHWHYQGTCFHRPQVSARLISYPSYFCSLPALLLLTAHWTREGKRWNKMMRSD